MIYCIECGAAKDGGKEENSDCRYPDKKHIFAKTFNPTMDSKRLH
jgi:hypothetical protein